jgi:hypothetical protein
MQKLHDIDSFFFRGSEHHTIVKEMELLLFAVDLILLINNVDLQDKLEFLSKYCKIRNLEVNIENTKILIFQKTETKNKCKEFKYGDCKFEIIKELYLFGTF